MQNRTRIAVLVLVAIAALACVVPLGISAFRSAHRPPVVITMPPGADNPPLPYASSTESSLDSRERSNRKQTADDFASTSEGQGDSSSVAADSSVADGSASPTSSATGSLLYVHVAGAVRHPGVYQLPDGSRVFNAVHAAGGALATGDTDAINLAEKLEDGEKVMVPLKGQNDDLDADAEGGDAIADADYAGPALKSGRSGSGSESSHKSKRARKGKEEGGGDSEAGENGRSSKITQGQIHLNTANAAQLERLPGVGPAMAARILRARKALGGFSSVTELTYVPGLGPGKYKAIEPFVTL